MRDLIGSSPQLRRLEGVLVVLDFLDEIRRAEVQGDAHQGPVQGFGALQVGPTADGPERSSVPVRNRKAVRPRRAEHRRPVASVGEELKPVDVVARFAFDANDSLALGDLPESPRSILESVEAANAVATIRQADSMDETGMEDFYAGDGAAGDDVFGVHEP
jgi:hypothetical protein